MTAVKEGDVFIMKHHDRDDASKSFYLIENVWGQEVCDVLVITFWRYTIPKMYSISGYVSDILAPPARGSREQGTSEDWFEAIQSMSVQVREYSKKVIEEAKE